MLVENLFFFFKKTHFLGSLDCCNVSGTFCFEILTQCIVGGCVRALASTWCRWGKKLSQPSEEFQCAV